MSETLIRIMYTLCVNTNLQGHEVISEFSIKSMENVVGHTNPPLSNVPSNMDGHNTVSDVSRSTLRNNAV